jgi:uncharacterized iron-regulated membrane protein
MRAAIRKYLLPVHRWTGLTVGLLVTAMAMTGAAIMFRPQLEPLVNEALLTVPTCTVRVPLDTLTAGALVAHPGGRLDYIRIVAGAPDALRMPAAMVRFTDQVFVYLDPCSGAVLGQRHRFGGVLGTIEQIHRARFMHNGSLVTGTCALLFALVLIGGGLLVWLPVSRRAAAATLRPQERPRGLNLHKSVGVYAAIVVLTSALTGLPQAFDWYRHGLYVLAGSAEPAPAPAIATPTGAPRLSMEALWQRALAIVPHPADALLHYEAKPGAAMDIYLVEQGAPHVNARSMLYLDPSTGATLRYVPYADSSAGSKLYFWTLSLHTGHVGGLFGQLLLLAGALCVPVLAWTGIGSYLRRRARAAAAPARAPRRSFQ